jgi:hypothetical protein
MKPEIKPIPIRLIAPFRGLHREPEKIRQFAARTLAGDVFPAIAVIQQSKRVYGYPYRLADGLHRTLAAKRIGHKAIKAYVITDPIMVGRLRAILNNEADAGFCIEEHGTDSAPLKWFPTYKALCEYTCGRSSLWPKPNRD